MKADDIARLLPAVFRNAIDTDAVLPALLAVMERLHAPVEDVLGTIDAIYDPRRAPDAFVSLLARWVDLERVDDTDTDRSTHLSDDVPVGRLRELIARSFDLSQWRGTSRGLVEFLEIATGVAGFVIEEPGPDDPASAFHLRVHIPAAASSQARLIERIVNSEKPAYTTWEPLTAPASP
jgi:phage tail-like protein